MVQIWQQVLAITSISTKDNFFELGGDSLKAAVVVAEVEKLFGQNIRLSTLIEAPTIDKLARIIIEQYQKKRRSRSLGLVKPTGSKRPFFYIHGIGGLGSAPQLARYIDAERPIYSLQAVGLDGETAPHTFIEEMVEHYIREIKTVQVKGFYLLGGQCIGGNIAFEMAQELSKRGEQVSLVVMADSPNPLISAERKN